MPDRLPQLVRCGKVAGTNGTHLGPSDSAPLAPSVARAAGGVEAPPSLTRRFGQVTVSGA